MPRIRSHQTNSRFEQSCTSSIYSGFDLSNSTEGMNAVKEGKYLPHFIFDKISKSAKKEEKKAGLSKYLMGDDIWYLRRYWIYQKDGKAKEFWEEKGGGHFRYLLRDDIWYLTRYWIRQKYGKTRKLWEKKGGGQIRYLLGDDIWYLKRYWNCQKDGKTRNFKEEKRGVATSDICWEMGPRIIGLHLSILASTLSTAGVHYL